MNKNLQCPVCFKGSLKLNSEKNHIKCTNCNEEFKLFDGVPYLGRFYEIDFLSIIETTSICTQIFLDENQSTYNHSILSLKQNYLKIQEMVELSADEVGSNLNFHDYGYKTKPHWFLSRYNEWQCFKEVIGNTDFAGKTVLDIGAGTGYDALRFQKMGANVIALEYNPLQASFAAKKINDIHWLGGSATHIPFKNESFDYVIANAALHHVRDLESAIKEMLRVLKVGGEMITLADSFSPNNFTESQEVEVFANHPACLKGVNEQIPHLSSFIDPLIKEKDKLDIKIFTTVVHGLHKKNDVMKQWSIQDAQSILSKYRGGLCMKIQKSQSTMPVNITENRVLINFSDYIPNFGSRTAALAALAPYVPKYAIDLSLKNNENPKLKLLLGWQPYSKFNNFQVGISQSYLFCNSKNILSRLKSFSFSVPGASEHSPRKITIYINGLKFSETYFHNLKWRKMKLQISRLPSDLKEVSLISISLNQEEGGIEKNAFKIREEG